MRLPVLIRPQAERDLDEQADFIAAAAGWKIGLRFLQAVRQTLELLSAQPRIGSSRRCSKTSLALIRVFPIQHFEKHLVFYRLLPGQVEIVRIIHGSRDIQALLRESAEID